MNEKMEKETQEYNQKLIQIRNERAEQLINEVKAWNPEIDEISKLILGLEECSSIIEKTGNQLLETQLGEIVGGIKPASTCAAKVKKVKEFMKKVQGDDFLICDKNGFCISSLYCGCSVDSSGDKEVIQVQHIDDLLTYEKEFE